MIKHIEDYFTKGCGRCKLYDTPQCKVFTWENELKMLRELVLSCEMNEEVKWGMPVYTVDGKNVVMVSAFKEYCSLSFFKGTLLKDPQGILITQTENSQSGRQIRFTSAEEINELMPVLRDYLAEAIEVEKSGAKVSFKKAEEFSVPEEFQHKLDDMPDLKAAFDALTPGRKKAYLLHFSGAKQAKTREERIVKFIPQILAGKGLYD